MRYIIIVCLLMVSSVLHARDKSFAYAVYYSDEAEVQEFEPFDLIVFDSQYHPPLTPLYNQGKKLLGYVSVGEVESNRHYYKAVKKEKILLKENDVWEGSYYVDVRSVKWRRRLVDHIIPGILAQGFDGIFMDTLDNPGALENADPIKYAGMKQAAVLLVKEIRKTFPDITIMMNRGYDLLPHLASYIDIEMGESVYADYDFDNDINTFVEPELYRKQVKILQRAKLMNKKLEVYTLDYWDEADKKGIAKIYKEQRKNGFLPYVATVNLDRLVLEPK